MLVHLDLSNCGIDDIVIYNKRLKYLNLSHNRITHFDLAVFYIFDRMEELIMSHNPLTMITNTYNMRGRNCYKCFTRTLDFSHTLLNASSLKSKLLFQQPNQYGLMNFSHVKFEHGWMTHFEKTLETGITDITGTLVTDHLDKVDAVDVLDVRGVPFQSFDAQSFHSIAVKKLYVDNFRLCCPFLHSKFPTNCIGPPMGPLSSCENILM